MIIVRPSIKDRVDSGNTELIQTRLGQLIDMLLGQKFFLDNDLLKRATCSTGSCWKNRLSRIVGTKDMMAGQGHAWLERDGTDIGGRHPNIQ